MIFYALNLIRVNYNYVFKKSSIFTDMERKLYSFSLSF